MKLINNLRSYILDEEFRITVFKNRVNIVNYINVSSFSATSITVKFEDGEVVIVGENLVVSRLLMDEILISGKIQKVEIR